MRFLWLFQLVSSVGLAASPCGAELVQTSTIYQLVGNDRQFALYRCAGVECSTLVGSDTAFSFLNSVLDGLAKEKEKVAEVLGCVEKLAIDDDNALQRIDELNESARAAIYARHRELVSETKAIRARYDAMTELTSSFKRRFVTVTSVSVRLTPQDEPLMRRLVLQVFRIPN